MKSNLQNRRQLNVFSESIESESLVLFTNMSKKTLKKFIIALFLLFSIFMVLAPEAAPIRDFPVTLVQPNGEVIKCFVSGDEYFNYYHDAAGYKIIQDPVTGYYTYAVEKDGAFAPSQYQVGTVSPKALGLSKTLKSPKTPNAVRKELIDQFPFRSLDNAQPIANAPKKGTINNIVVFIRFSGEAAYTDSISSYSSMFNSITAGANSMRNYFAEASYNQLTVSTTFYPTQTGATVISYQDGHPRGYYQPYSATNTIGYDPNIAWNDFNNTNGSTYREFNLINHAANAISSLVPSSLNIDGDGDGNVDNVCFIVSGSPGGWSSLLWPHQWSLYYQNAYINNKRVFTYNLLLRDMTVSSSNGVGVLAHEMSHSVGIPDLYHYNDQYSHLQPVGQWDLMENTRNPPQHMTAYMKYRYGSWIASIPTITASGTYTLNPLTSANDNAYRINSPNTTSEYFIVEYRRRTGTFEASLPGEGLIVYRIITAKDGEGNMNGPPDEVYVFRPDGTVTANGSPDSANFGTAVSRTAINDSTNPSSFLSNGDTSGLNISNIGTAGSTISFTVTIGDSTLITLDQALDNTSLAWTTTGNTTWRGQAQTSYFGGSAAQSGLIANNQSSNLSTVVTGPATLTYYWKVSSEIDYDYLRLLLDGAVKFAISGEVDWQQKTVTIPAGQHTLRWSYNKDESVSSGADSGWVDKVEFNGPPPRGDDLVIDFGPPYGIYAWLNGGGWSQIHSLSGQSITAVDFNADGKSDLAIDFGAPYGIYALVNSGWGQIHSLSAKSITAVDFNTDGKSDLAIDFGSPYGIYSWMNEGGWSQLHSLSAKSVTAVDFNADGKSDLAIDFGAPYGIYAWVNGGWIQIHSLSAKSITAIDFNADGKSDLAIDFGAPHGIWVWVNGGGWSQLHSLSAKSVTAVDFNTDGTSDLAIDFGAPYGIYALVNGGWNQIHPLSAKSITAVYFNADGKSDLVVDFGSPYGIWAWVNGVGWSQQIHSLSARSIRAVHW